ncbi:uncharacterized protein [Zea mays]|uniref:Uncharacterized protein n=1 Tax=Zea mays TaxID=4577 RepID=A0A804P6C0_MAIZE|nr:uncharacterized protein LOC103625734 isoform X1 [Zea mays]XP_008644353.1 uncharacterized protein LOC103625734 isoform X1 [Zea mays]XP_008644354.1 uncharacterized protein LOC103625734 isoform X1 [Zea mays]XP_035814808.1 uncharacterized protein LOC103625734 isoform X1 [Zea mays]|eukprot:XP_008644352.1 uncharacterized protein LOC103625734 isoform X1 [Zea mays]
MYFSIWRLEREQQRETDVEENHRSNWLGLRLGIWQTGCVSTKIQNSLDQKLQLPIVVKGLVLRTLDKVSCCYKVLCIPGECLINLGADLLVFFKRELPSFLNNSDRGRRQPDCGC